MAPSSNSATDRPEAERLRLRSTHVLAAIRAVTRLECAGETLRAASNALAVVAPVWLQAQSQPEWVERYSERIEDYHLPVSTAGREQQALLCGKDGKRGYRFKAGHFAA